MVIDVVGRHLSLAPEQRAHARAEAEKLGKFFDGINEIDITFEREHEHVKSEIVCRVSGNKTLVAVEQGATVDEALEFVSDNMARQIKKHKAKLHDRRQNQQEARGPAAETGRKGAGGPAAAGEEA
jgi:ribosomal subunit interface protein